jgi:hypothetical protein
MRTAEQVINQAITENRKLEYVLCGFSVTFVVAGVGLLVWFVAHGSAISGIGGIALNGLAWPAYHHTSKLRQQNLMLRMLEIPLSKARTAEEAAKMLTEQFARLFKPDEGRAVKKQGK